MVARIVTNPVNLQKIWQGSKKELDKVLYKYNNMSMPHGEQSSAVDNGPLYNRLAVLRAERGLTRAQLAAALAVNYQTIGYIERGDFRPSLELAFRMSEYFGLPIEAIFSRKPFRPLSEELYGNRNSTQRKAAK